MFSVAGWIEKLNDQGGPRMSAKGKAGKAAWAERAARYPQDLTAEIVAQSEERMEAWAARGRIPMRVRIMARLSGRPLRLPR
jgi:hypothetical protein